MKRQSTQKYAKGSSGWWILIAILIVAGLYFGRSELVTFGVTLLWVSLAIIIAVILVIGAIALYAIKKGME